MVRFSWDINKNVQNIKKHKVSFEEASTVFDDENGILINDPDHSIDEERFILIGFSARANMLIVCHCYIEADGEDDIVRIISARKPTKSESKVYLESNDL